MAKKLREKSPTGYYHVTLRGNGRQIIFEDDEDRKTFLRLLSDAVDLFGARVIAWCLMSNHVHVVIDDPNDEISAIVHRFAFTYAQHFNNKSGHVGALFQGRFHSVPITSDEQLLQTVRYIHDNPVRAGISAADKYPWSSFSEYTGDTLRQMSDVSVVLELLGGKRQFLEFSKDNANAVLFLRLSTRIPDGDIQAAARPALGNINPLDIKAMELGKRDQALTKLRAAGLSWRQMEMLTGIGAQTIRRAYRRVSG